ncbi:carbon-nitrogen hydrolase family protein [Roseivirga sp. UBA838]|uniref:carbon-nitrogen hydrolase family protein n=1 Tax=Roseivirga sp. UBA838 TaxID=1947393 RepID=UPI00257BA9AF|nr:carbon-nitrogen hydrolase family protein [Roseivirga sp. UBA838]|tara:strand:- start:7970 stop:8905 length:936 start_codon:yes stop_codon:yes gene_type:complete
MKKSVRIGIVQSAPSYLNVEESMRKVEKLLREASEKGAQLITFGETWFTGYPAWIDYCDEYAKWDFKPTKEVFAKTYENSLDVKGKEVATIGQWAKELGLVIVMGINEKVTSGPGNGTIYNSLLTWNEHGELVNHHRKLMPTYTERLIYGHGDGHGLKAVETQVGRIGGLICWEHWMPLTRQTMHNSGEHIHVAVWPKVHEMLQIATRSYAFEGRCFAVGVGQIMRVKDIPAELTLPLELQNKPDHMLLNGGSCIVGPDGHYVMEPIWDKEGVFVQEVNLTRCYEERMALDVTGHYQRNDVFELKTNTKRL